MCKMWSTKDWMILFCIWYIGCVSLLEGYTCDFNYKFDFNKSVDDLKPEGNISAKLTSTPAMKVLIAERHADFTLTVFSIPSIKNKSDCPKKLNGTEDIQQYEETCTVYEDGNENRPIWIRQISTGCYYFMGTNAEGNNWVWPEPVFHETSLPSYYTTLKLEDYVFKPATLDKTMELNFLLRIPLRCILVCVQLFQLDKSVKDAKEEIKNSNIQPSQERWFTKNDTGVQVYDSKVSELVTKLGLEVTVHEENENEKEKEWTASVSWKELQRGGGVYYLWVRPYLSSCEERYGRPNVTTWTIPSHKEIFIELGDRNELDVPSSLGEKLEIQKVVIICTLCILLGGIVVAILIFRKYKYFITFGKNLLRIGSTYDGLPECVMRNGQESNNILLMYARDSPELMEEMNRFRSVLEQNCHCHVDDLYTQNVWESIASLGPEQWVDKLLRDGTKIVWVDTPKFRSHFNDQQDNVLMRDTRDDAIPYAVALAKILFKNANTQYRYLFVVRVKGFEVNDELEPDPLLGVSPHTRYYYPGHLAFLCEHLRNATMQSE